LSVASTLRRGDTHVADSTLALHGEQCGQVVLPVEQVVYLQQIEPRDAPQRAGFFDLLWPPRAGGDPDLGRRKQRRGPTQLGESVADDTLRGAVHRRGVDEAATLLEEGAHHGGALVAQLRVVAYVEGDPAPQADDGDLLAAGRDRLGEGGGAAQG